jgi:hypothetical protein
MRPPSFHQWCPLTELDRCSLGADKAPRQGDRVGRGAAARHEEETHYSEARCNLFRSVF